MSSSSSSTKRHSQSASAPVVKQPRIGGLKDSASLGDRLRELVEKSCNESNYPFFKNNPKTWGVTNENDGRFTDATFGNYKSGKRLDTEAKLRKYMREPSTPRAELPTDFSIAATVAAPGTGKTRLIDDALRMSLDVDSNNEREEKHFEHFLRLAVTFTGHCGGTLAHPLAARMLVQFFCGTPTESALDVLQSIDAKIGQLFANARVFAAAHDVLDALESLFCAQRGGDLARCRSVLLIDEISQALTYEEGKEITGVRIVYEDVIHWLNFTRTGRRGAVFSGMSPTAPWFMRFPSACRRVVWLPLGTFDLWSGEVRAVVAEQANWPRHQFMSERVWQVLAAAGGRPRDVLKMLENLRSVDLAYEPDPATLLQTLLLPVDACEPQFQRYLLASMLGISFCALDSDGSATRFGFDTMSPALLNSDDLAGGRATSPVAPTLSLAHAAILQNADADLFRALTALISAATFCTLDGSGTDFERVWVLLVHVLLRLQHVARHSSDFWPVLEDGVWLGGLARPTDGELNVFAACPHGDIRVNALFGCPGYYRVCNVQDSSINCKLPLTDVPKLAWWHSAWTPTVQPGDMLAAPAGWPVTLEAVWRSWTVVYFAEAAHAAIDFALMAGDAGGAGDNAPHLYLFTKNMMHVKPTTNVDSHMASVVGELRTQLDLLFSADFAATHVWRRAGINSAEQVTLCVAAINLCTDITDTKLEKLNAPFNVVLFDKDDFRPLGKAAFRSTCFFRQLDKMNLN